MEIDPVDAELLIKKHRDIVTEQGIDAPQQDSRVEYKNRTFAVGFTVNLGIVVAIAVSKICCPTKITLMSIL